MRLGAADHAPAPLLLAGTVLTWHETEVARHLCRSTKARDVIQRRDVRARGDGTDARQCREARDDQVLRNQPRKCLIRPGQLLVEYRDQMSYRCERRGDR